MVLERYIINKEDENYKQRRKAVLAKYGFTKLSPATIYHYIIRLGFKYKAQQKGYYIDGYKRPATIEYRDKFIHRYLKYEQRIFRWTHITLEQSIQLQHQQKYLFGVDTIAQIGRDNRRLNIMSISAMIFKNK